MDWNACKIGKVSQIFRQIGIYRDDKSILKGQVFMEKSANSVSVIGGADGPTSIFLLKKNAKLTLRHKIQRTKKKIKRFYVGKTLSCESHSLDEVIEYIVNRYRFAEVDKDAEEFAEEYKQMRASFIIQYAPELLGESATCPELKSESPEDVEVYIRQNEERMQRTMEIPSTEFDIDFHKFKKAFDDINDTMYIVIEKNMHILAVGLVEIKRWLNAFGGSIKMYTDITVSQKRIK